LNKFYGDFPKTQAMIFVNKKATAEFLLQLLMKLGRQAITLTSDQTDAERDNIMDNFRQEKFPVLISTNVLARGIDVPAVDIVINYDIPEIRQYGWSEPDYANYLHRVGRTGRFGTDGIALTFFENETEESMMEKIEKEWETEI
jgi:ATP-dependent RNA helicase DDX19/DBP5